MEFLSKNIGIKITRKELPFVALTLSAAAFLALTLMFGLVTALSFAPVLCAVPVLAFMLVRGKKSGVSTEKIMNEAPTAIGMMRLMTDRGASLDSVVRAVAKNGPPHIARMFSRVVWDVDTKASPDIRDSLNAMLCDLPDALTPFKRAMYLIVSASDSKDAHERTRITKDADDTMLEGLKQMGESYSSKLNAPCMAIFGLGVMVPMILVSILPMLSVGGQFSSAALDPLVIAALTLIVIPAVVGAVIMMIASKNPFYVRSEEKFDPKLILPAAVCVPIFVLVHILTNDLAAAMALSAIAAGFSLFAVLHPKMGAERKKVRTESIMGDVLFDLGNRLLSGENFEKALVSSFRERKDCGHLAASLEGCISVSRGDTEWAIYSAMSPYSKKMADMYADIHTASLKDLRDAGRLAVSMGHQLQDQNSTVNGIRNKLRSMLDMMTGTSAVFAPLILGISVSMLAPLMDLAGGSGMSFTTPILMMYLIELAALISLLTTQLRCKGGLLTTLYSFSMMMPIALIVFLVSSGLSI
ncbi:MAG: hypothetical protein LBH69_01385 [Methanomassiliicoccaceae archaeon]|jgi:Flp pilus assembly protein TadB|nr:hypothetical protein [Methanomassiliicoccaceae archaeon]